MAVLRNLAGRAFLSSIAAGKGRKRWAALWGNGDYGRLGLGRSTESSWIPTLCGALRDHDPISIACGGAHTLILTEEGKVFSTGLNDCGQLGLPLHIPYVTEPREVEGLSDHCVHIVAGYYHSAAITEVGEVYVWGDNSHGQLGLGKKAQNSFSRPQMLESLKGVSVKMLALGAKHSLALTGNGEVLSWGAGDQGQLGHGLRPSGFQFFENLSEYSPRLIKCLQGLKMQTVAAGSSHSACIDDTGILYAFGQGSFFQLGQRNKLMEPFTIRDIPPVRQVTCGGYHSGAITRNGDIYMWGGNEYGCLGLGYRHQNQTRFPMKVEGRLAMLHATEVSCGWKHTAALCDGQLFMWGWGGSQGTFSIDGRSSGGQLGLGNEFDFMEPTLVSFNNLGENVHPLQISCGFNHTGAILEIQMDRTQKL